MNKDILKVIKKREKKNPLHQWWFKNEYKIKKIIFFPIYLGIKVTEKIEKKLDKKTKWNEKRADLILNYYIPRRADWDPEEKTFYFFDNGMCWNFCYTKRYLKRKDYRFWKLYGRSFQTDKIRAYLVDKFEIKGFKKTVLKEYGDIYIKFGMIEK